jgi:hypothetical protein
MLHTFSGAPTVEWRQQSQHLVKESNMRRPLSIAILLASLAAPALAAEGVELSLRAKSLVASATATNPAKDAEAPFRLARDPIPDLFVREEEQRKGLRGACDNNSSSLCYDMVDRRVVYRPARALMPKFEGMRAESISLRSDRLVLKYSFR